MTNLIIREEGQDVTLNVDVSIEGAELKDKLVSKKCGLDYVTSCIYNGKLIYDSEETTTSLGVILKERGEKYGREVGGPADNLMDAYIKNYTSLTKSTDDSASVLANKTVFYLRNQYESGVNKYNAKYLEDEKKRKKNQERLYLNEQRKQVAAIKANLNQSKIFQKKQRVKE